jgi:hypothetical protein
MVLPDGCLGYLDYLDCGSLLPLFRSQPAGPGGLQVPARIVRRLFIRLYMDSRSRLRV